jgi:FkbM family methyltransferase
VPKNPNSEVKMVTPVQSCQHCRWGAIKITMEAAGKVETAIPASIITSSKCGDGGSDDNDDVDDREVHERRRTAKLFVLPTGEMWEYLDRDESDAMYQEIFERNVYFQEGITLRDGDLIFDVGCNIGLFSLYCATKARNLDIIGFEPLPPIAAVAARNYSHFSNIFPDSEFRLFPSGVSNTCEEKTFFYYANFPGESSRFSQERESQRSLLLQSIKASEDPAIVAHGEQLGKFDQLNDGSKHVLTFGCRLATLCSVIQEMKLSEESVDIDLLKIDVEGDELNVLLGLEPYWPIVKQIVMEVHDVDNRLENVKNTLTSNGFSCISCIPQSIEVSKLSVLH